MRIPAGGRGLVWIREPYAFFYDYESSFAQFLRENRKNSSYSNTIECSYDEFKLRFKLHMFDQTVGYIVKNKKKEHEKD